jgi:hypothetical protein
VAVAADAVTIAGKQQAQAQQVAAGILPPKKRKDWRTICQKKTRLK